MTYTCFIVKKSWVELTKSEFNVDHVYNLSLFMIIGNYSEKVHI